MMPRLDGMQLLAQLRSDPRTAKVPVILLSARAGEEAKIEGLDAGADDYLVEPSAPARCSRASMLTSKSRASPPEGTTPCKFLTRVEARRCRTLGERGAGSSLRPSPYPLRRRNSCHPWQAFAISIVLNRQHGHMSAIAWAPRRVREKCHTADSTT